MSVTFINREILSLEGIAAIIFAPIEEAPLLLVDFPFPETPLNYS
jgi:hypothetical protein